MKSSHEFDAKGFIDYIFVEIIKYLNLNEIARMRETCKMIKELIDNEQTNIFEIVNIRIFDDKINMQWLTNILKNNQIKKINLILCENCFYARTILFAVNPIHVEELKIPLKVLMTDSDLLQFITLRKLTVKNMYFNEGGEYENIFLLANILQMPWISYLKLNNIKYAKANFVNHLVNRLVEIDFRECVEMKVDDMIPALTYQAQSLIILRIDGEMSSQNVIEEALGKLQNLRELYLGYCENFTDGILTPLAIISYNLTKLTLRKLRKVTSHAFEEFFEYADISNLTKIDFYDAPSLNNKCVTLIAKKSLILEFLEISWSSGVKNDSVILLLTNCVKLKKLFLQGCKALDDNLFNDFIPTESTSHFLPGNSFLSLRLIDFSKCDMIEDITLRKMMEIYPALTIINYYGIDLKKDEFF